MAADDVKVTEPPGQNEVGPPAETVAVGDALTVTDVAADVAGHPKLLVAVTL